MNQNQRTFLIEQVTKTCTRQTEELEAEVPDRPLLNNYLVKSCYDNTLELHDINSLRDKIMQRLLKADKESHGSFVDEEENGEWDRVNRRYAKSTWKQEVTLNVTDIFVLPKTYLDEMEKYESKKKEVDEKIKALQIQRDTIIMKIQIGSASKLENLVLQIDSIGDLNLMDTNLILGATDEIKKLSAGGKKN